MMSVACLAPLRNGVSQSTSRDRLEMQKYIPGHTFCSMGLRAFDWRMRRLKRTNAESQKSTVCAYRLVYYKQPVGQ
jgi:hypothetical protein